MTGRFGGVLLFGGRKEYSTRWCNRLLSKFFGESTVGVGLFARRGERRVIAGIGTLLLGVFSLSLFDCMGFSRALLSGIVGIGVFARVLRRWTLGW